MLGMNKRLRLAGILVVSILSATVFSRGGLVRESDVDLEPRQSSRAPAPKP